jgi:hypothetical protein
LLRRAQRRPVQLRTLTLANFDRKLELDRSLTASALERDARGAFAEANELRVRPRAG